jgi:hypothetical protein
MNWTKSIMQGVAILAVSLSPALKASALPSRSAAPPCAHTAGLNEARHRRRVWQQANRAALEKPGVPAADPGSAPLPGSRGSQAGLG